VQNGLKGNNETGKKSHRGHGCLSLVSVVCCCQVEASATSRSLVQWSPTDCGVSQCDQKEITTSTLKRETGVGRRGRLKGKVSTIHSVVTVGKFILFYGSVNQKA
jgi:hypothetical protein